MSSLNGPGFVGEVTDEDEAAEMEDERTKKELKKKAEGEKQKLTQELSDCVVICQNYSFKSFEELEKSCKQSRFLL